MTTPAAKLAKDALGIDWADTESVARQVATHAAERIQVLEGLMQEFCDRVDRGEVRSTSTYAKFKEALSSSLPTPVKEAGKPKLYGDPTFGSTLDELRELAPYAKTVDGVSFSGDARKVGAILKIAGSAEDLIAEIDRLSSK